jgi:hypothetical protein
LIDFEGVSTKLYWEVSRNIDIELEATIAMWKGMSARKCYNYILLRSSDYLKLIYKIRQNDELGMEMSELEQIEALVEACFYVGKGQGDRPLKHLAEALKSEEKNEKVNKIREIWEAGEGVIIYKFFQNSSSFEASTREAIIIDFMGKHKLTNVRHGTYYGCIDSWELPKLYNMGFYYALMILLDIQTKNQKVFLRSDVM